MNRRTFLGGLTFGAILAALNPFKGLSTPAIEPEPLYCHISQPAPKLEWGMAFDPAYENSAYLYSSNPDYYQTGDIIRIDDELIRFVGNGVDGELAFERGFAGSAISAANTVSILANAVPVGMMDTSISANAAEWDDDYWDDEYDFYGPDDGDAEFPESDWTNGSLPEDLSITTIPGWVANVRRTDTPLLAMIEKGSGYEA